MKKGMLFVLMMFAILFVSACGNVPMPVQTPTRLSAAPATYPVVVDYSKSLDEMIAAGNFDYISPNITAENFPVSDCSPSFEPTSFRLVNLGHGVSSDEVLAELDRLGLRPATLPEALAFAAEYPDLQKKYVIIALGAVWSPADYYQGAVTLTGSDYGRYLSLSWSGGHWPSCYCFLAAPKYFSWYVTG